MTNHVGFLSLKHHWAFQPSQHALDGKLVINFTLMPNYVVISIHLPIILIPPNLLWLIPSSFFGFSAFILLHSPYPLRMFPISFVWSFFPQPHIPCPFCSHLLNGKARLAKHQLSCTTYRQSFVSRVVLPLTLPCSLPSLTWTSIASIDIINVFHLDLSCPYSYHHIPYALQVDTQRTLHILKFQLTFDPSNIAPWHVFQCSIFGVYLFFHGVARMATKRLVFTCINTWVATRRH